MPDIFTKEYIADHCLNRVRCILPSRDDAINERHLGRGVNYSADGNNVFAMASPFNKVQQIDDEKRMSQHEMFFVEVDEEESWENAVSFALQAILNGLKPNARTHGQRRTSQQSIKTSTLLVHFHEAKSIIYQNWVISDNAKRLLASNDKNSSDSSLNMSSRFIDNYGTHFMGACIMGAVFVAKLDGQFKDSKSFTDAGIAVRDMTDQVRIGAHIQAEAKEKLLAHSTQYKVLGATIPNITEIGSAKAHNQFCQYLEKTQDNPTYSCTLVELYPYTDCDINIQQAVAGVAGIDMLQYISNYDSNNYANIHNDLNERDYKKAALELLEVYKDPLNRLAGAQILKGLFSSRHIFAFGLALKQVRGRRGAQFITAHFPEPIKSFVLKIKDYFKIQPERWSYPHSTCFLMINGAAEGALRTSISSPFTSSENEVLIDEALWQFKPVHAGKFFLLCSKKSPDWYAYMKNDEMGRVKSYRYIGGEKGAELDDQALWIITPEYEFRGNKSTCTLKLSTRKWPNHYMYVSQTAFGWIVSHLQPEARGSFHITPAMR